MKTVNVVAAIISAEDNDGQKMVLATQRGYGDWKGGWEFPGGKVEAGETPEQALAREIREELDTEIEVGEYLDTIEYDYPTFHLSMRCYWCTVKSGDIVLKEHEAAKWLTKDTIGSVDWLPADITIIDRIREKLQPRFPKEKNKMKYENVFFITGTAYAGKSTMVKLLAEKYDGILCEENYHDRWFPEVDKAEFPCLSYTRELKDWHEFVRRTPEEYKAWSDGSSKECEILELRILEGLISKNKPIFVDTNISPETLRKISDENHVLIMLAEPDVSVRRFFERPDKEKQFIYQLLMEEPDPEKAMENYRKTLMLINSQEKYDSYLNSGFKVIKRDENRTVEQTLALVEQAFGLAGK